ncbi:winged helix DNA-binding domain-containing protein [Thermoactinospora rubra]|uniref:winged helix DNA-binding domain-containing protein n=1 Tax=Thermoactinospora rubra TaxID=1088767 RepID=UPI000A11D88E|nr:winged helix DNA-binding domain-containing protein [Thermoactinospora rubra]
MDPLLTRRALNRATLRRQWLVERAGMSTPEMVEHLAGLQAQTPHSWYTGLWNRIEGFRAEEASRLLETRRLVRIALQRGTIHLVTARDCLAMRPLLEPVIARMTRTTFGRRLAGVDLEELAAVGRALVEERPMTFAELGKALAARWPGNDPHALGQGVRWLVPLVQVPPRGLWGRSGPVAHTSAEHWLGLEAPPMTPAELVRRYLAAFGPASVKDVQTWSGLTRLKEVVDGMDLPRFRDEEGRVLYDLPDAARPDPDLPVPVRLMYDFDNLFLSHDDRSRVLTETALKEVSPAFVKANVMWRLILVDGFTMGDWTTSRAGGTTTLTIHQWRSFAPGDLEAAVAEARRLLAFLAPGDGHEVLTRVGSSRT